MKENERRLSTKMGDYADDKRWSLQDNQGKSTITRSGSTMSFSSTVSSDEEWGNRMALRMRRRSEVAQEVFTSTGSAKQRNSISSRSRQSSWTIDRSSNGPEEGQGQEEPTPSTILTTFYKPKSERKNGAAEDITSNTSRSIAENDDMNFDLNLDLPTVNRQDSIDMLTNKLRNLESRMNTMEEENQKLSKQLIDYSERESIMKEEMKSWLQQEFATMNQNYLVEENSELRRQLQDMKCSSCGDREEVPMTVHSSQSLNSNITKDTEDCSSDS